MKRKQLILQVWLVMGFLILAPLALQAENFPTQPDSTKFRSFTLETIRVIARRPQETIGTLSTLNLTSGQNVIAGSIKEALENNDGLNVTTGTKDESSLRVRGFYNNDIRIMVDGRPLNAGYFGKIDLQNMPLSEVSEIQILKGPVSSIYGANTMGGVVNLITSEPSYSKWLKLGLLAKRNNTNQLELSVGHSFQEGNFWVYGSREHTDGMVLPEDFQPTISENGSVRNNDSKTQYNIQAKGSLTVADFHTLGLSLGLTTIDKKLIPSSIYEGTNYRLYKDWQRYQATLMGDFVLSDVARFSSMLYIDGGGDTYQNYTDPLYQNLDVDSDMRYHTMGCNPKLDWHISDMLDVVGGYSLEWQQSTRRDNGFYPDWTLHQVVLHHLFSQARCKVNPRLDISGSLGFSVADGDLAGDQKGYAEPALGFYYELPAGVQFTLASGLNTSYPSMHQLFSTEKGNPELRPQTGLKTEATMTAPFNHFGISGALTLGTYFNRINDRIDLWQGKYANVFRMSSWGYEPGLLLRPIPWIDLSVNYYFLDYRSEKGYLLTETPHESWELGSDFHLPWGVEVRLSSDYKDTRKSQDSNGDYHGLKPYWMQSALLSKSFGPISVRYGLENILDESYEEEYGFPGPGCNYSLKLEAEL